MSLITSKIVALISSSIKLGKIHDEFLVHLTFEQNINFLPDSLRTAGV